jgi:Flp pilus assembly protein TadG
MMKTPMERPMKRKTSESGSSIVEVALLAPWIFFLFVGVFDFGFYAYGAICTQNAARIAALQTASNPALTSSQLQTLACNAATLEMVRVPNKANIVGGCASGPLLVTQATLTNSSSPLCADCAIDATAVSSLVAVTYQSNLFVPIPGILENQLNLTRTSEVRMIIP